MNRRRDAVPAGQRGPRWLGLGAALTATLWSGAALAQDVSYTVGAGSKPQGPLLWAFWILGGLTVAGAVATITRRNPVVAAVCLVGTLFASAGLYLLLHATFLAVIQVLVYAGAIMVLFVLVVMSVEHPEQEELGLMHGSPLFKLLGIGGMVLLLLRAVAVVMGPEIRAAGLVSDQYGTVTTLGKLLFTDYLFPFEAISILLLAAVVGAVVVTRSRARAEATDAAGADAAGGES